MPQVRTQTDADTARRRRSMRPLKFGLSQTAMCRSDKNLKRLINFHGFPYQPLESTRKLSQTPIEPLQHSVSSVPIRFLAVFHQFQNFFHRSACSQILHQIFRTFAIFTAYLVSISFTPACSSIQASIQVILSLYEVCSSKSLGK